MTAVEIIYDGDCGFCQACIAWVQRQDSHHAMVAVRSAALTAEDVVGLPVHRTVVVRTNDGSTLFGSQAVAAALGSLPGNWGSVGRVATRLLAVAPFRAVGDWAYNAVANHRSQISAFLVRRRVLDSSCQVPRP
jgi:predicted DCC family thiol-disulfide oxidoreductase YuxK